MTIVLGFDFGMKHVGVAVGQKITKTAAPLITLAAKDGIPNWTEIRRLIKAWRPTELIVGIPLNMDGTEQAITFAARKFGNRLRYHFHLPVHEVDERLSSWEAKNRIFDEAHSKKKTKDIKVMRKEMNAVAAAILVEQFFLDSSKQID